MCLQWWRLLRCRLLLLRRLLFLLPLLHLFQFFQQLFRSLGAGRLLVRLRLRRRRIDLHLRLRLHSAARLPIVLADGRYIVRVAVSFERGIEPSVVFATAPACLDEALSPFAEASSECGGSPLHSGFGFESHFGFLPLRDCHAATFDPCP